MLFRLFIDKLNIVSDLKIEFGGKNELNRICCLNDDKIWICGKENFI